MSHFQKGWLIFCSVVLMSCGDTIHKHYYPLNDASMAAEGELDAMQPPSPRDCRFAEDECASGFVCEAFDAGHRCVRGPNDEAMDALVQPEPDTPPRSEVVVFPEDIGPIGFRKPMGGWPTHQP